MPTEKQPQTTTSPETTDESTTSKPEPRYPQKGEVSDFGLAFVEGLRDGPFDIGAAKRRHLEAENEALIECMMDGPPEPMTEPEIDRMVKNVMARIAAEDAKASMVCDARNEEAYSKESE